VAILSTEKHNFIKTTTMKRIDFTTHINASPEKVWGVLWNDATYRQWTSAFSEGSYAVSDWKEGSGIQFLGPNGDGMFSKIDTLKPNEFMSFTHLGVMKEGVQQPEDETTQSWSGSKEMYTLKSSGDGTDLKVELDSTDEFADYFTNTFPNALEKVKTLAESA
jgi:uncharacterized protein YndB with AHSA1/START domain